MPDQNTLSNTSQRYQTYPSNIKFFFKGRILTGHRPWLLILTFTLLIIPKIIFSIFVCPWIWKNISPATVIIFIYFSLLILITMMLSAFTDPGILPRDIDLNPTNEMIPISPESTPGRSLASSSAYDPHPARRVVINDYTIKLKYCETCKIYRPPRSLHCHKCDNCVDREDHHCVWLNNCIGKRNYRFFYTFLISTTLGCLYIFSFSLSQLVLIMNQRNDGLSVIVYGFLDSMRDHPATVFLLLYTFLFSWSLIAMSFYHTYLVLANKTTHEQMRSSYNGQTSNPFTFSNVFKNCYHVLCIPQAEQYVDFRENISNPPIDDHSPQSPPTRIVASPSSDQYKSPTPRQPPKTRSTMEEMKLPPIPRMRKLSIPKSPEF